MQTFWKENIYRICKRLYCKQFQYRNFNVFLWDNICWISWYLSHKIDQRNRHSSSGRGTWGHKSSRDTGRDQTECWDSPQEWRNGESQGGAPSPGEGKITRTYLLVWFCFHFCIPYNEDGGCYWNHHVHSSVCLYMCV